MRKVQFGCGGNKIAGWENYDTDVDITKRLPFKDESVDFVLAEHVVEHVTVEQGYKFLKELKRILAPKGVARICVPGADVLYKSYATSGYGDFMRFHKLGDGSIQNAMESIMFGFGHRAVYTTELLTIVCDLAGFKVRKCKPRISTVPELNDIDAHWTAIGEKANAAETIVVELFK